MLLCGELSRGGDGGGVPVYIHIHIYNQEDCLRAFYHVFAIVLVTFITVLLHLFYRISHVFSRKGTYKTSIIFYSWECINNARTNPPSYGNVAIM